MKFPKTHNRFSATYTIYEVFSMKHLKRYTIIGIFFVLITGTLAHFLYDWTGSNHIVGLFTPINESIWEHMKLLFFPMLIYSLIMILKFHRKYPCITSALSFGIFVGTLLIPIFFYAYTSMIGGNIFILDIGTFILSIIIAFRLSYKLTSKINPALLPKSCLYPKITTASTMETMIQYRNQLAKKSLSTCVIFLVGATFLLAASADRSA